MPAKLDKVTSAGNRGSHYNKGAEYIYYVNETEGQIWRQPINPATMIVQQNPKQISPAQAHNLNAFGAADLKWTGSNLQAQNGAKLKLLNGYTSLEQISPDALTSPNIAWDTITDISVPENGQSATGNFYAVKIAVSAQDPHYAKLRIYKEAGVTKIEWIAYSMTTRPWLLHTLSSEFDAPRDIVVSPYETDVYVSGGAGMKGYVVHLPRIVGGPFPQYSTYPTPLSNNDSSIAPILSPQQMVVDGSVVYVVAEGGLFLLDPANGIQVQVVSGITAPVGLLLDKQLSGTNAYISDSAGHIYIIDITKFDGFTFDSDGNAVLSAATPIAALAPSTVLELGGPSGFLTWTDDTHTAFYATVSSSAGTVKRVDLVMREVTRELTSADPALVAPWSVEVFDDHSITVVCDAAIVDIERGFPIGTVLLHGIGLIPFDFIKNSVANPATPEAKDGTADTSSASGYYFSAYHDLSFGGSLSLLINHQGAWNSNLRYYKVSLINVATGQSRAINNAFVDLRWNATAVPPRFEAVTTGAQSDLFPVRNPTELWYNSYLSSILNTALSDNGHNRIKVDFFDANKQPVASASYTRLIFINNTRASATLANMRRGTATTPPGSGDYQSVEVCGLAAYDTKNDLIEFDLTASHPSGSGTYVVSFYRGGGFLFSVNGNVTATPTQITVNKRNATESLKIGHLTGNCDIAGVTVRVDVPTAGSINGYGWVELGTYTARSFSLAKAPVTHTNWP